MNEPAGLLTVTGQVFTSPEKAFENLKSKGKPWFPLIIFILITAVFSFYYFSSVDFAWYVEHLVSAQGDAVTPAQKEQAANLYKSVGLNAMMFGSMGAMVIFIPVIFCIYAVYFLIVSNIRNDNLTFGQSFTIACWSNLVGLVSTLIAFVYVFLADNGQIPQSYQKGLNINDLLINLEPGHAWYTFTSSFDLASIWVAIVSGIGYKVFANSKTSTGLIIGLLPVVVVFGIWALIILL